MADTARFTPATVIQGVLNEPRFILSSIAGRLDSLDVRFGNRFTAETDVAFDALETRILLSGVNLVIQSPTVVGRRGDVAHTAR